MHVKDGWDGMQSGEGEGKQFVWKPNGKKLERTRRGLRDPVSATAIQPGGSLANVATTRQGVEENVRLR